MRENENVGILLINTGTTAAPKPAETREYLREFLSDPRVIDWPALLRWFVLNAFILPTRPKKSAEAYAKVWTAEGSPILAISRESLAGIKQRLPHARVEIGMRYGEPSIPKAMDALIAARVDRIIAAPLFPQYASAANGSALELVYSIAAKRWNTPNISALPAFYSDEGFLRAWEAVAKPKLDEFRPDYVLLSYHGLPERHVKKTDPTGAHCLQKSDCCDTITGANQYCYRAHCFATSRELVRRLRLKDGAYSTSFQSRLGRDPWLLPPTDQVVPGLARKGVKRLAVMCPAFVADCLETLEEIGIRAKESFIASGGEDLVLVPSLNAHPAWLDALAEMLRKI
ncbi:MAG: ferrochelatase [Candidatus Hydrogenedentes bacterium]|nr:ferrochelatase [Candidatus Hydrogenedentota bacterium]